VSWSRGRLDSFGAGDGRAYHKFFDDGWGPGGIGAEWEQVSGPPVDVGVDLAGPVTAVSWEGNRLDIFGVGTDGRVYHQFFDDGWGLGGINASWESVGQAPAILGSTLGVVSWSRGRLDLFGAGDDGRAYHQFFDDGWGLGGIDADWEGVGGPAPGF
jgi:hypothetical protein